MGVILNLKFMAHPSQTEVDQEFRNVNEALSGFYVQSSRAPAASDRGVIWVHRNGAQLDMYLRDWVDGSWKGPTVFS